MKNKEIIFLKLGSFLISDRKTPFLNIPKIREIATQIHTLRRKMGFRLLIGHDGGLLFQETVRKFKTAEGIINNKSLRGQSIAQNETSKLNLAIVEQLIQAGENVIPVSPSTCLTTYKRRIKSFYLRPIKNYLKNELVPVIHEDVVFDSKQGCSLVSVEQIFKYIIQKLRPTKAIMMYNRFQGVKNARRRIVTEITKQNYEQIKKELEKDKRTRTLRRTLSRLQNSVELAKKGVKVNLIGGKKRDLEKCLKNKKVGTVIKW